MDLKTALEIVLELASANTLVESKCDNDPNLINEAKRHERALEIVTNLHDQLAKAK
jgi:hypothetical protein